VRALTFTTFCQVEGKLPVRLLLLASISSICRQALQPHTTITLKEKKRKEKKRKEKKRKEKKRKEKKRKEKKRKEKKRKDYAFRRQFIEKPSIIPGCPLNTCMNARKAAWLHVVSHICLMIASLRSISQCREAV